ncbi:MAG: hypothetical protein ACHQ1H_00210 [Nitrososphaerales archaeon]
MEDQNILKDKALQFGKKYYLKHSKAPAVRDVQKKLRISSTIFYQLFSGIEQFCQEAGIPASPENMKRMAFVQSARSATRTVFPETTPGKSGKEGDSAIQPLPRLWLNDEQSMTVRVISHLEGKDPSLVIDRLLEDDAMRRREHGLSLADTKIVWDFLATAKQYGLWTDDAELGSAIGKLSIHRIDELPKEIVFAIVVLVKEILRNNRDVADYVYQSLRSDNMIGIYRKAMNGEYSEKEAIRALNPI